MAKQTISIGTAANDRTGSTIRAAMDICNDNFTELYAYASIGATAAATPSNAELVSALGTAATNGAGWHKYISCTNGGSTYYYLVVSTGTVYLYSSFTAAS